ncbi:hypothetical protein MN116_002423 [Schistosoma mekongi]|uniref:Uncharacterized protein n=1 Tax=Schistosoma mekongi TaxID=38744 RepID=A0AAE2D9Q6_SCHME|nr:hypothetical protein MN116_002423 [Schistosoma mekongi]
MLHNNDNLSNDHILCTLNNKTLNSNNQSYYFIITSNIMNDSRIDTETYRITQICLSLSFCSTLLHIIFIFYFKRIRQLYGICIIIHYLFYSLSYLMMLITCSLSKMHIMHTIFRYLADYCILTTMTMNLKSTIVIIYSLMNQQQITNLWCKNNICLKNVKTLCYIIEHIIIIGLPISSILLSVLLFDTYEYNSVDHKEFAEISCNLLPNHEHFYVFFPIIFILLLLQFICIIIITKYLIKQYHNTDNHYNIMDTLWKTTNINTRYWITIKFTITHSFVWFIAFLALLQASIALWHVFTLLFSLQAIYIIVNCTFTRPILDLLYQWREEMMDYYKNEHNLYIINHIINTNQQKDTKRNRNRNISIDT